MIGDSSEEQDQQHQFHKPITIREVMKISEAKAALDKRVGQAQDLAGVGLTGGQTEGGRGSTSAER